ncbi:hypothetical protein OG250_44110 [Streptomyces sp. NBC_00487]|uniref:hypothetical protein n=1 Tax=unclassified Streptomyces TaxID=2593676 RepID=UPI002E19FD3D|nr:MULTISPECIES: hypothetical protein [unclassified Streptomyces]
MKYAHELVGVDLERARTAVAATVDYARTTMGEDAWREAVEPEIPTTEVISNPYTYSEYRSEGVAVQNEGA